MPAPRTHVRAFTLPLAALALLAVAPAGARAEASARGSQDPVVLAQAAIAAPASGVASAASPAKPPSPRADRRSELARIVNWGYQLKRISKSSVAASPFDLMVIDYAPDRVSGREEPFTRAELAAMQRKPGGGRRLVFAYFSIGEAERYRSYWQQSWYSSPPDWLGPMNPQWAGNYPVKFWNTSWQSLMFGSPRAYLDRILDAGFDGIYIDRADVADYWLQRGRPGARSEMASLIARLSAYARQRRPDILILMQNAEELLEQSRVIDAIDGVAKEDLFYGINHDQSANSSGDVAATVSLLQRLKRRGKAVLVVEYLSPGSSKAEDAIRRSRRHGYVPLIAGRALEDMPRPAR